jgi:hypothetical protein
VELNHDLVVETLGAWRLPRLTIDVDGTVVSTGAQVQWAFRGFNPHPVIHRRASFLRYGRYRRRRLPQLPDQDLELRGLAHRGRRGWPSSTPT